MHSSRARFQLVLSLFLFGTFLSTSAVGEGKHTSSAKRATILTIRADLDSAAALPSNSEPATGDLVGTYDTATHVLKFQARFFFLTGQATNARFHGPAAIDLTASATVAAPRPSARLVVGTAWLDSEEARDLLAGRWYFNVTTEKHPQGEIRGMVRTERPLSP